MSEEKTHDLYDFMLQISDEMAAEYNRIQKRATEDPGTAGDQGEENWAELLRGWLPRTYEVVTKGRIISQDGRTSPQVDVLVLKSVYPEKLLNKKLYLAAGVAAAFECKTTLKAEHIEKAVKTCTAIKNLYPVREGTPYKELHTPIVYGLLAHSHSWKGEKSKPEDNIRQKLLVSDILYVSHPRECLDLLCVADLATWTLFKSALHAFIPCCDSVYGANGPVETSYIQRRPPHDDQTGRNTPIGNLISSLSRRIAWEDPVLRDFVNYYWYAGIASGGTSKSRPWPTSIYSEKVRRCIQDGGRLSPTNILNYWNEWQDTFHFP